MATEPTLTEIVREALESRMLDVWSALPCRVESYDSATNTVDCLPMVRRAIPDADGKIQHEELPVLPAVPVAFQQSAAFSATYPLAKGDYVLVVFSSLAIGNFVETGDLADPGDIRRNDLSHGVAIAGLAAKGSEPPTLANVALFEVGGSTTHVQVGAGAAEFVVLEDKMISKFNSHTHTGGSGGPVGAPTTPLMAGDIGATKLKAE